MSDIRTEYFKQWLKVAADILAERYVLHATICIPDDSGKCNNNHHIATSVDVGVLQAFAKHGLAPSVYCGPSDFDVKSLDDFRDKRFFWLGDITREGDIACGELLKFLMDDNCLLDLDVMPSTW